MDGARTQSQGRPGQQRETEVKPRTDRLTRTHFPLKSSIVFEAGAAIVDFALFVFFFMDREVPGFWSRIVYVCMCVCM